MILHGNQRGGAAAMAQHLLNTQENDQVTVSEVRGSMSPDLMGALREFEAVAKGTRCKQYLYSCSFNPPQGVDASLYDFEDAIERAEQALGLTDQPRVVVFHEKHGRRHAHVVWSRIDTRLDDPRRSRGSESIRQTMPRMKAINLAHTKRKLFRLSRDLFLDHDWELPKGYLHLGGASPDNFTMAQWQQAQRFGLHPKEIKQAFQNAWAQSDDLKSFAAAISEQGYRLAKGDRRVFVAVDLYGNVYSIPKWLGLKTREVKLKLGSPEPLPTVEAATSDLKRRVSDRLLQFLAQAEERQTEELAAPTAGKRSLTLGHRAQRETLTARQTDRWRFETLARQDKFNRGWRGLWDRLSGRYARLKAENELETKLCRERDVEEREALFKRQMAERRSLQKDIDRMRARHVAERRRLHKQVADYLNTPTKPQRQPSQHDRFDDPRRSRGSESIRQNLTLDV